MAARMREPLRWRSPYCSRWQPGPAEERVDRAHLQGVPAKFSDVYFSLLVNIEGRTLSRSTTLTVGRTNSGIPWGLWIPARQTSGSRPSTAFIRAGPALKALGSLRCALLDGVAKARNAEPPRGKGFWTP